MPSPLVALAFIGALAVAGAGASSDPAPPGNAETMMAVVVDEFGPPEVLREGGTLVSLVGLTAEAPSPPEGVEEGTVRPWKLKPGSFLPHLTEI